MGLRYSHLKGIVLEARNAGLRKIPKYGMWYCTFCLPFNQVYRFQISNANLIHSRIPIERIKQLEYERSYRKAWGRRG